MIPGWTSDVLWWDEKSACLTTDAPVEPAVTHNRAHHTVVVGGAGGGYLRSLTNKDNFLKSAFSATQNRGLGQLFLT